MLVQCNHCGAPLDVSEGTASVKCAYCDTANRVRSMRTIARERPASWQPPAQWTPPESFPARRMQVTYHFHPHTQHTRRVPRAVMVMMVLGLMVPLFSHLVPRIIRFAQDQARARAAAPRTSEPARAQAPAEPDPVETSSKPILCEGDVRLETAGIRYRFTGAGPAVIARDNCRISLSDYEITSAEGIEATDNAVVTVRDSRLDIGGHAVLASGNGAVRLVDVDVRATTAIDTLHNAEVTVQGGSIEAADTAARAAENAAISIRGTRLSGALACTDSAALTVDGASRCTTD